MKEEMYYILKARGKGSILQEQDVPLQQLCSRVAGCKLRLVESGATASRQWDHFIFTCSLRRKGVGIRYFTASPWHPLSFPRTAGISRPGAMQSLVPGPGMLQVQPRAVISASGWRSQPAVCLAGPSPQGDTVFLFLVPSLRSPPPSTPLPFPPVTSLPHSFTLISSPASVLSRHNSLSV